MRKFRAERYCPRPLFLAPLASPAGNDPNPLDFSLRFFTQTDAKCNVHQLLSNRA